MPQFTVMATCHLMFRCRAATSAEAVQRFGVWRDANPEPRLAKRGVSLLIDWAGLQVFDAVGKPVQAPRRQAVRAVVAAARRDEHADSGQDERLHDEGPGGSVEAGGGEEQSE